MPEKVTQMAEPKGLSKKKIHTHMYIHTERETIETEMIEIEIEI